MKNQLRTVGIWIAIVISGFSFQNLFAAECSEPVPEHFHPEKQRASESFFLESLEELNFDQENITLNVEGCPHAVHTLRKAGNHWIASINARTNYCPQGHPICVEDVIYVTSPIAGIT